MPPGMPWLGFANGSCEGSEVPWPGVPEPGCPFAPDPLCSGGTGPVDGLNWSGVG